MALKNIILTAVGATGMFAGTAVGLLAVQGRLNYEGTRGVPLLEKLFTAPPESAGEHHDGENAADGHAKTTTTGHEPPAGQGDEHGGERLPGLGREAALPRETGPSVKDVVNPGGTPLDHGGSKPAKDDGDHAKLTDPKPADGEAEHGAKSTPSEHGTDFKHQAESLMGQDQYRRGQLYTFPRLDSGMGVGDLNQILTSAQELQKTLERRQAALDQRETELTAREDDVEERERQVLEKMREVLQARQKLDEDMATLQKTWTMVRGSELEQLRNYGQTLAGLGAEKASQILLQMWTSEEGKVKATKILKLMEREAVEQILGVLTADQTQAVLDRMANTVIEQKKQ